MTVPFPNLFYVPYHAKKISVFLKLFLKKVLTFGNKRCIIPMLRTAVRDTREWRNWQTRTFEGRVVHTVRVQVPFPAPERKPRQSPRLSFCYGRRFGNRPARSGSTVKFCFAKFEFERSEMRSTSRAAKAAFMDRPKGGNRIWSRGSHYFTTAKQLLASG